MPEAGYLPIPKKLATQGVKDMVRVSDARMSGTAFGSIVLHVTPEAALGGPLALVQNGDTIRLDVAARRIDLLVDDAELARRREALADERLARRRARPSEATRRSFTARCCRPTKAATSISSFPAEDIDEPSRARRGRHRRHRHAARRRARPTSRASSPIATRCSTAAATRINLLGTTGEATAFSVEQRLAVMRAVADAGLPLERFMVGTGVPALADTVRLTRAACELGFAGALVLPPFFYPHHR